MVLDWHSSSLDESWDSRLPTPLALDFSAEEEDFAPYTNGGSEVLCKNNGYTGWFHHYMFLGVCPPTPPLNQYLALSEKCYRWLRGGVGGQFPKSV